MTPRARQGRRTALRQAEHLGGERAQRAARDPNAVILLTTSGRFHDRYTLLASKVTQALDIAGRPAPPPELVEPAPGPDDGDDEAEVDELAALQGLTIAAVRAQLPEGGVARRCSRPSRHSASGGQASATQWSSRNRQIDVGRSSMPSCPRQPVRRGHGHRRLDDLRHHRRVHASLPTGSSIRSGRCAALPPAWSLARHRRAQSRRHRQGVWTAIHTSRRNRRRPAEPTRRAPLPDRKSANEINAGPKSEPARQTTTS